MGANKKKKAASAIKRRQMIEEVFKKGKKLREIAKKFDDKIAQKQGSGNKRAKLQELKSRKKMDKNHSSQQVMELDKKLDNLRNNRKPGSSIL